MPIAIAHSPIERSFEFPRCDLRQALRVDLDDREIVRLVGAKHLGRIDRAVAHHHRHLVRPGDDVGVGDDHAIRAHDESRAEPGLRARLRAAEEHVERILRRLIDRLGLDRDDRWCDTGNRSGDRVPGGSATRDR